MKILGIAPRIRNLYIEHVDSPWNEKALIKRKKDHLDVKVLIWDNDTFLYGRIHHIFLYIVDVLSPSFLYDPQKTPDEERDPVARNLYNQIWSIFVDSRLANRGIESFYDRALRRSIFIDTLRGIDWRQSDAIFTALWDRVDMTYPEIIDLTYKLLGSIEERRRDTRASETCLVPFLREHSVRKHIDQFDSEKLRAHTDELLSFTAYNCKDVFIQSTYYGIVLLYQNRVFVEMIPKGTKVLLVTIYSNESHAYSTTAIEEDSDLAKIESDIKEEYRKSSMHSRQY